MPTLRSRRNHAGAAPTVSKTTEAIGAVPFATRLRRARYGRTIRDYARRAGLPDLLAWPAAKAVKLGLYPGEYVARRRAAAAYLQANKVPVSLPEATGYRMLGLNEFAQMPALLSACRKVFEQERPKYDLSDPKNQFRNSLLKSEHLGQFPVFLRFAMAPEVLAPAVEYMGVMPTLASLQLWWTPLNSTTVGSQLYHRDNVDFRLVKYFVNVNDVEDASGPLTFLPADVSARVTTAIKGERRSIQDEEMFRYCSPTDQVALVGGPGSGGIVDSCRCYHYGGRARGAERLLLMIQYLSYHCIGESSDGRWFRMAKGAPVPSGVDRDVAAMLLKLPPSPVGEGLEAEREY